MKPLHELYQALNYLLHCRAASQWHLVDLTAVTGEWGPSRGSPHVLVRLASGEDRHLEDADPPLLVGRDPEPPEPHPQIYL